MTVQLALYKGKGTAFNGAVRWWTGSIYSHCELVVDGLAYSSSLMDGGVRKKWIDFKPEHWDFVELPWADADAVTEYLAMTDDDRYSVVGLLVNQIFNRNRALHHAQFCSEWCANAVGIPSPGIYSPATLGRLCKWMSAPL